VVSIVGYTNAGKSTLLNALSGSKVLVEDKLFATLDPTTRRVRLPDNKLALFTDTVGFIQKLPTQLVAAFRATLEEIEEADLLLHVIDISHPNAREQAHAVEQTLVDLNVQDIPLIVALNKVDRLPDPEEALRLSQEFPHSASISATKGIGLDDLLAMIQYALFESAVAMRVRLPLKRGDLIALFHQAGVVDVEEHHDGSVLLAGRLPARLLAPFRPFVASGRGQAIGMAPEDNADLIGDEEEDYG
jgi:GTP-binding protein HflX